MAIQRTNERTPVSDADFIAHLIGEIYEAATDTGEWVPFLRSLAESLKLGAATVLMARPQTAGTPPILPAMWGLDDGVWSAFVDHYASVDPCVEPASRMRVGAFMESAALVPEALFMQSEYYNDFYAPTGMRRGFAAKLAGVPGSLCHTYLAGHREARAGEFDAEDRALVNLLVPHLQRSHQLTTALGRLDAERVALASVLDRLPVGVVLVGADRRIVRTNAKADAILRENDGLTTAHCQLEAARADVGRALHRSIGEAIATGEGNIAGSGGALRISRPSHRRDLSVVVGPVTRDSVAWQTPGALAVVTLSDGEEQITAGATQLRSLYGLTVVESELACHVANGSTLQEVAEMRGVALQTVRKQLKQVFAKTGVSRQPELVRLILLGPALLSDH